MAVILLVAARATTVADVQAALESGGHRVLVGHAVPRAFEGGRPDLLLIDLDAGPTGFDDIRRLKSSPEPDIAGVRVGVVAATGSSQERLESAIEGAVLYVTRPIEGDRLRRDIDRVLTGEPEAVQRKGIQDAALRALVRLERTNRVPWAESTPGAPAAVEAVPLRARLAELNERQRSVLEAIAASDTREEARQRLGIGRSLLGATLRSAAHRLQFKTVSELVAAVQRQLVHDDAPAQAGPLLFQPIVELAGGRPLMLEAMPTSPAWSTVRSACEQASRWRMEPGPWASVGVSVDVAGRRLAAPGTAEEILGILHATGLEPKALTIEVADTVAVAAAEEGRDAVSTLRAAGVRICVDHFGSERSSLASLLRLEADMVKLDGTLLADIGMEHESVLPSVIALAASVSPLVAAEGVATTAQLVALESAGCIAVQGPLVGEATRTPYDDEVTTSDRVGMP